jgi:uncharacterized protein (TIGR02452 family)
LIIYHQQQHKSITFTYYNKINKKIIDNTTGHQKPSICVRNEDLQNHLLKNKNHDPDEHILVLNLASRKHYGGGVKNGAMAQEEELFRKTDYYLHEGSHLYPLKNHNYTSTTDITIVKDKFYNRLPIEQMFKIDCMAIAGISFPKLLDHGHMNNKDTEITMSKIENIFLHAMMNNYRNLVLRAIGCGLFKNPTEDIISMHNTCLKKYYKYFDYIIFSVFSNRDNNYSMFHEGIIRKF